ncbi:MAG: peptidase T [Prevotellaceae bacterium]|jgi:tripeptide aminopeptidase|nr:peptidase T [Prevotellaceae bacterium]
MIERFFKYLIFNTQSDENATSTPSTEGQRIFAEYLAEELRSIGMSDVIVDEHAYLTASLPANFESENMPTIGLIAHLDTSPEMSGENVNFRIVEKYDGKDIVLNQEKNIVLSPQDFPELKQYIGQDIIVTEGLTLLGADDKAGIAEIVSAMEYLIQNPDIKRCHIRVAFTPDEEIGHGARLLDIEHFGADWAYTVDGGELGEIEFENFNAAQAVVKFKGRNLHPGYAKGKMQNSMLCANEFISALPKNEIPAETEYYEGFFHLLSINGTVEETVLVYIVRDHDAQKFEERKKLLQKLAEKYNAEIEITEQYRNMREQIEPVYHIVERAISAMERVGVEPKIKPVRGGTDGAQLSFRGLPCPNIFTGGHNFHGRFEFIPVQSMEKAKEVIIGLVSAGVSLRK